MIAKEKINVDKVTKQAVENAAESKYTVDEFIEAKIFDAQPELIKVAFMEQGLIEATEKEAKVIVSNFRKREVK